MAFRSLRILFALLAIVACAAASFTLDERADSPQNIPNIGGKRVISGFIPKRWPAVIAVVLYSISALIHWRHAFVMGRPFMWVLPIGMMCMAIGFIIRIIFAGNPTSLGIYIITTMFVLLSPCAFLAMDYILLNRLASSLGTEIADKCLFIPAHRVVKIFLWSDGITFLLQSSGGGLQATERNRNLGKTIAMAGLAIQLLSFILFTLLLLVFGWKVRRNYAEAWHQASKKYSVGASFSLWKPWATTPLSDWRILFAALGFTCIGILIRSTFRLVEYGEGFTGFLSLHEGYFYLLDSLPLWIAMTTYCFVWPTRFVDSEKSDIPMEVSRA